MEEKLYTIILGATGFVIWLTALYVLRNPPEKRNGIYGYRTKRSRQSQEAWDFAQIYSSELMKYSGLGLIIFSGLLYFVPIRSIFMHLIVITGSMLILLFPLYWTERELKARFPK